MSWRRPVVRLAAVVAVVASVGGGYLTGSSKAPTPEEASAASRGAEQAAFGPARAEALDDKRGRGIRAGLDAGESVGRRLGVDAGEAAAELAIAEAKQVMDEGILTVASGSRRRDVFTSPPLGGTYEGTGDVLVVGDSLEVLTSPYLQEHLPSVGLTIDAVGGYSSAQIFELFQASYDPSQSVIVFDAGTNDNPSYPQILAETLQKVADIVGDRCMVVPTIHGLPVDGVDSTGKNRVVAAFARSRPGTQVPDWAGAVAEHPELMQPDNLHPLPEGADYRAQLIADGVRGCLEGPFG